MQAAEKSPAAAAAASEVDRKVIPTQSSHRTKADVVTKQDTIALTDADKAALLRVYRAMRTASWLHWAAIGMTALRYVSRSLEGWLESRQVLDPSWVIVGATDCLALVGLAVTLDAGAAKVHETALGKGTGNAIDQMVALAGVLGKVFENLKVAWTVQGMVMLMWLSMYDAGAMSAVGVVAVLVLAERIAMQVVPGYPYRNREAREATLNPLIVTAQVITPEAPSLQKMLQGNEADAGDSLFPQTKVDASRESMSRHTYLLPNQVASFADVVGHLVMTGGAEGRLLFASIVQVFGNVWSRDWMDVASGAVSVYGYYSERRAILGTAALLEETLDAECTLDEIILAYGGKEGVEVPFVGADCPSVAFLFRCLGEAALTIGLNNVFVGIWGVLQVANLDDDMLRLYDWGYKTVLALLNRKI